jgi:hypothetical protein
VISASALSGSVTPAEPDFFAEHAMIEGGLFLRFSVMTGRSDQAGAKQTCRTAISDV